MKRETLYCPMCARDLYDWDGKSTIGIEKRCECGRFFFINPTKNIVKEIKKPDRTSSSGMRFI